MQITIKTLQNSVFKIESELDVDVANLKKKIEEQNKDQYPVDRQKLIYQVCSHVNLTLSTLANHCNVQFLGKNIGR